ncbi:glycoside hydrolase domain-containing protein [Sphaerisporangium corydalis]|uniref:Glycoside hydrolase domain-containing protein n=1 Tax=Sphaerisporangium corydalis TaxID=1441875 RepID=A0ABV9EPC4_9ACTN|nr:glycoside hydrolase domain-containing protein [Sphaerisporangium corydalis]
MVLRTQQWVNSVYEKVTGYQPVPEDGRTGWATVRALVRALQHELAVTPLSDTFGSATLDALTARSPVIGAGTANENLIKIVQGALYCKGYDGSGISGTYDLATGTAVAAVKTDMGVDGAFPAPGVVPKVLRALLTMDAYRQVKGGSARIREVQRWLNSAYAGRRDQPIVACDGRFSRDAQRALLLAIQYELGMDDDTATGRFGERTQAGIREQAVLGPGATDGEKRFVRLFQSAMIVNGWDLPLDGSCSPVVADTVLLFQQFARLLPANGIAGYQTWASLLVSHGDATRRGTACDCVTAITPERAGTLRAEGYTTVGRYLTNTPGTTFNKKIQPGELDAIAAAGLTAFPIFETGGRTSGYFSPEQGAEDALTALEAARGHGFARGTTIYFAVDFDAQVGDVTQRIIPYFRSLATRMKHYCDEYRPGVYGSRDVCGRLARDGLTVSSFVADLSSGFGGNLGFPLPDDWAFDQISTITVGSGSGGIEIDNDIASGRDAGQAAFAVPPRASAPLDTGFDMSRREALLEDLAAYLASIGMADKPLVWPNSTEASLDTVLRQDSLITGLSRVYRMRKALIQSPMFWETRRLTAEDALADLAVTAYYGYRAELEAWHELPPGERTTTPVPVPPFLQKDDASAGSGRIFARTAIAAHNHAVGAGLIEGEPLDPDDWHVMRDIRRRLRDDPEYTAGTMPQVIAMAASEAGVDADPLSYDTDGLSAVLARYHGTGEQAEQYGRELSGVYAVFEKYNATLR